MAGAGFSVGRLARRFGLSRTALLYYDRIGLLRPSARSGSNYRLYDETQVARLEAICLYRAAGLSLSDIRELLRAEADRTSAVLARRLEALNREIGDLREQQRIVLRLLKGRASLGRRVRALDKERWVALLRASGLSDTDMERWHAEFERREPEAHQDFLESLGISPDEIRRIRALSRQELHPTSRK